MLGIVGMITGIIPFTVPLGLVSSLLALVLSGIGIAKGRQPGVSGRGVAIGGVVTGLIGLVMSCLWIAVYRTPPDTRVASVQAIEGEVQRLPARGSMRPINELQIGDCFDEQFGGAEVTEVPFVPCAQPHRNEVYAILDAPGGPTAPYPGPSVMEMAADDQCRGRAFNDYIGRDYYLGPTLRTFAFRPSQRTWAAGDREVICVVFDPAGPVTGSLRGSAQRITPPASLRPSPLPSLVPRPLPPLPSSTASALPSP
jgi:hypothetical protein